jgi:hypothetical protein
MFWDQEGSSSSAKSTENDSSTVSAYFKSNTSFNTSLRRNSDTILTNSLSSSSFLRLPFQTQKNKNSTKKSPKNLASPIDSPLPIEINKSPIRTLTANYSHGYFQDSLLLSPQSPVLISSGSHSSSLSASQQNLLPQKLSSILKQGPKNRASNTTAASTVLSNTETEKKPKSVGIIQNFNNKFMRKRHSVSILKFSSNSNSSKETALGLPYSPSSSCNSASAKLKPTFQSPKNSLTPLGSPTYLEIKSPVVFFEPNNPAAAAASASTNTNPTLTTKFRNPFKLSPNASTRNNSIKSKKKTKRSKSAPINPRNLKPNNNSASINTIETSSFNKNKFNKNIFINNNNGISSNKSSNKSIFLSINTSLSYSKTTNTDSSRLSPNYCFNFYDSAKSSKSNSLTKPPCKYCEQMTKKHFNMVIPR